MPASESKPDAATKRREHQHSADFAGDRALKGEEEARRQDPHGAGIADAAGQDEPKAWPTPDRRNAETTTGRVKPRGR